MLLSLLMDNEQNSSHLIVSAHLLARLLLSLQALQGWDPAYLFDAVISSTRTYPELALNKHF